MSAQTNPRPVGDGAGDLGHALGNWAAVGHGTLAQRLALALRQAVISGRLADHTRLPPERALATSLAVSRATVSAALDELRAEGLVTSRRGSGTTVRGLHVTTPGTRIAEHFLTTVGIDLAAGNPADASHLPAVSVDVADLLAGGGGPGVQPLGLPSLRSALAERHTAHGRVTDADQVHVTAGAHQALALTVGALVQLGQHVAVEDPSYPGIFDIIETMGCQPLPVRRDRAGVVPDALDRTLAEHRPPLLYLQTGPHNPTGRIPVPARMAAVAEVLDRHDTVVIEDCTLAELTDGGPVRPELGALCRRAVVVSVGSFSKVAWAGLRIGWLRAPAPLVERTLYQRLANDLGASVPAQLMALQLIPHLDDLALRRRAMLAERVARALERLRADLPTWTTEAPGGGSVLWIDTGLADAGAFVLLAARHGVHVAPGSIATPTRRPSGHIRISVDRPLDAVDAGIDRLALAWRELAASPSPVLG